MKLRAPAIPLITVDPFFSVWSPNEKLNFEKTVHWTGKSNSIIGVVNIDGVDYSFLGYDRNLYKMKQVSLDIDALSTKAVFDNGIIRLTVSFLTPLIPDDLRLLTRPVSYMELSYESADGASHNVTAQVSASEELCLNVAGQSPVAASEVSACKCVKGMKLGNKIQVPLNRSGDDHRIDWGYFYLMAKGEGVACSTNVFGRQARVTVEAPLAENESRLFLFAYDDVYSVEYFGEKLRSYWNRGGQTIEEAICEAAREYDSLVGVCKDFSDRLYNDAFLAGGEKYAELLSLSYRQIIAGHKLVLDGDGEILYISKECHSNGSAATVDVSYPSIPMFLLYNPELVKGMMRPIYKFAATDDWKYDFAPHDIGQYPICNGQGYGRVKETRELRLDMQMPVEECGNMIIMEAATAFVTKDASFAESHFGVLEQWVKYLIKNGTDPENQLCTDDFAGHLAHNCNLSLKAIIGIRSMAMLCEMLGKDKEAEKYVREANKMAKVWMRTAKNEDGTTRLAFDRPGTYSMKYNMVWDKLFGFRIFSRKFMDFELMSNRAHFNEYGMPLDSRSDYTKSDWMVWTASMASSKKSFMSYVAPLWKAYNESASRVPMTDWYDTLSAREVSFRHRTVQGGLFMKVLMDKYVK